MTWGNFHYLCCVLQHLFSKETQSGVVMCKVPICILSITFFLVLQSMVSLHQILMPSIPTKGKRLAIKTSFSTILALMVALLKILICIILIRIGRLSQNLLSNNTGSLLDSHIHTPSQNKQANYENLISNNTSTASGSFLDSSPHTHNKYQQIQNQNIQTNPL